MKNEMYGHIQEVEQTHWWYVARRKIILDWVFRALSDCSMPYVLDIGCGTGFNVEILRASGYSYVVGLDMSAEALSLCRSRNLPYLVCGDGTRLPLCHESFDVIMALDLIEHLNDDVQALRECSRLLKPNGSLIIFVPAFNFLWGLQDEVSRHRRRYRASELRQTLEAAELTISKLTYANTFLFPLILAGRTFLRLSGYKIRGTSENDLHPRWSNGVLQAVFSVERQLLRFMSFPFGVSLFCVAKRTQRA